MKERAVLRELSALFGVAENDLPKTIRRFRQEAEEMEKKLGKLG